MIRGLFITGTGTGVGKTMVTAGILRQPAVRSLSCIAMKPVQTGAVREAGARLVPPDLDFVLGAAGLTIEEATRRYLAPYLFEPACSPHLAARLGGEVIKIDKILECARRLAERYPFLLVEGAGGVLVPLSESETMVDLMERLGLPVLLVGPSGLGAINQVLLSLEALRRRRIAVRGVVLNDQAPVEEGERFICEDNVRAIEAFGRVRVLARIPYLGEGPDWAVLDRALASHDFSQEN